MVLAMVLGLGVAIGIGSARNEVKRAEAAAANGGYTKITLDNTSKNWAYYSFWLDGFEYESGYNQDRRDEFIRSYYVTEKDNWGKTEAQGTSKSYRFFGTGVNVTTDISNGVGTFVFPSWIKNISTIQVENGADGAASMGELKSLRKWENNTSDLWSDVIGNSVTISANDWGWWSGTNRPGFSSSTTTASNQFSSITATRRYLSSSDAVNVQTTVTCYQYHLPALGSVPSVSGYSTDGKWYSGTTYSGATSEYSTTSIITSTSAIDVVAKYTSDKYTITYDKNGGSGSAPASQTPGVGQSVTLATYSGTKTGYNFTGWNTNSSGTGDHYDAGGTYNPEVAKDGTLALYAEWTIKTYTITYDRNVGEGSAQESQSKQYGQDVNALTPGTGELSAEAWNPSQYHYFKHWNTAYDDSDVNIDSGEAITSNDDFTLYYIEDWYEYRYTINGGTPVYMTSDSAAGGTLRQFAPASAQELPLHGILNFQVNRHDGNGWVNINNVNYESGSNYNTTTGIQLATIDTIFLKLCTDEIYNVWVPGISERTIKITHGGEGTPYTMKGNGDTECVTVGYVYAVKGDMLEAEYGGGAYKVWLDNGSTGFENTGGTWETSTGVRCTESGAYTVYLKKGSGEWHNVWISRNEEASAKHFAQLFNNAVSNICLGITGGSKDLDDLKSVWGNSTSTGLYGDYTDYSSATKAYFTGATSTSDGDILACIVRYDYVVNKYGTNALPNFFQRNNSYPANAQRIGLLNGIMDPKATGTVAIIVVISSLVAIGAFAGYFFYKKKKEDK